MLRKKVFWALVLLLVLTATTLGRQEAAVQASPSNPYLWPYNQGTNISFNHADVYQAWVEWRDGQITSNNAGGNGRLRVMGGVNNESTVSEGQAYGILFASLFDEQNTLDGLYLFAKDHFNSRGVMDWHIGNPGQRIGSGAATDAEVDMALGLVNACIKVQKGAWPASSRNINYCTEATNLINAIYTYEIEHAGSAPPAGLNSSDENFVLAGDSWNPAEYPQGVVNLSYFPPGYLTVFGKFTNNTAAWEAVNTRNYQLVNTIQAKAGNCSKLVPNWVKYNGDVQVVPWQPQNSGWWSYDAARFAWRVAVDEAWYARPQAVETMNEIGSFFSSVGLANTGEHQMSGQLAGAGPYPFFVSNAASAIWAANNRTPVNCGAATGTLIDTPQSAYNRVLTTKDSAPWAYYGNAWRLFSMLLMTGNFPNFYEMAQGGGITPTPVTVTPTPVTPTPLPGNNLAQGKPATASSVETSNYPASLAVDGNNSTRW